MSRLPGAVLLSLLASGALAQGAPPQSAANQPYTMEYYYKTQWGRQQEFLQLFLKNHYPLLQKEVEQGLIFWLYPTHPGEMLAADFMPDYDLSVAGLAEAVGVTRQSINELLRGRRAVSPEMAVRSRRYG